MRVLIPVLLLIAGSAFAADPPRPARPAAHPAAPATQPAASAAAPAAQGQSQGQAQGQSQGQAQAARDNAPKSIGKFDDWMAATHQEAGQLVCYAFSKANKSEPGLPGRGDVVLTVTERVRGRDAVAISAGFAYGPNAEAHLVVDQAQLPFYTSGRSAFARDGKAVVAAFEKGRQVQAKSPGPRNQTVTDTFSLRGFTAAYQAITKACPAR